MIRAASGFRGHVRGYRHIIDEETLWGPDGTYFDKDQREHESHVKSSQQVPESIHHREQSISLALGVFPGLRPLGYLPLQHQSRVAYPEAMGTNVLALLDLMTCPMDG